MGPENLLQEPLECSNRQDLRSSPEAVLAQARREAAIEIDCDAPDSP